MNETFRSALRHTPDCPPLETLIANGAAFEEHTRTCAACQTELALYRSFEAGEPDKDERSAVEFIVKSLQPNARNTPERISVWRRFLTPAWMGGAALAMAAVLLAVGLTSRPRVGNSVTAVSDDGVLRTTAITITSPTGEITGVPSAFEWKPVEGAAQYAVTLSEVDHTTLFHKNVTSSGISLPDNIRTLLVPGKRIFLEVTAINHSGSEIAHSGTVGIRVTPNSH